MPKNQPERIIDTPFVASARSGGATVSSPTGGTVGAHALDGAEHTGTLSWSKVNKTGSSLADIVSRDHGLLTGLTDDDHSIYMHISTARTVTAQHTFAPGSAQAPFVLGENAQGQTVTGLKADQLNKSITAGNGLTGGGALTADRTLAVGAGNGIAVAADSVAVSLATNSGLTFDSTKLAMGTPASLSATTTNSVSGESHVHTVTASSNPGAASSLLKTDSNGSIQFDTSLLHVDATTNTIGVNVTPNGGAALDVRSANNDDITLRIKQKSGQTARLWRVENSSGTELIVLDSVGNLQSGNPGFVSGLTGWRITPTGNAEFNNIWARGELHASVFVLDEFHASGGTLFVASASKLENDADIDVSPAGSYDIQIRSTEGTGDDVLNIRTVVVPFVGDIQIRSDNGTGDDLLEVRSDTGTGSDTLEARTQSVQTTETLELRSTVQSIDITDPPSGHAQIFQPGDVLRAKTWTGTGLFDHWYRVNSVEDETDYYRYRVEKVSGTDATMPAGTAVVSYGQAGDGRLLLTSDQQNAPYMDVFTVGAEPWDGDITPHVRIGRLDGVGVSGVSGIEQYGMIAGTDLSDANSPYIVASDQQLKLFRVDMELHDGTNPTVSLSQSGRVKLGTDIQNATTTGFDFDPTTGNLTIGNPDYPGAVTVYGEVQITDGNVATVDYVDSQDSSVLDTAKNHADSGDASTLGDAKDHADSGDASTLSDAKDYADSGDASTLSDAKDYVDVQVGGTATSLRAYTNARRVVGVTGDFTPAGTSNIIMQNVTLYLADGTSKTVSNATLAVHPQGRTFYYVDITGDAPLTMQNTLDPADIGVNNVLIAVGHFGTVLASVRVVAGSTYISGDFINTGSIVANNIASSAITADKIAANAVTADKIVANAVTAAKININDAVNIASGGSIRGNNKTYGSSTAGFFIGHDSGAYKVDIGDSSSYLRWNGSALSIKGSVEIVSGSTGFGNLSDAPTKLSDINSSEGSKLSGIQNNATAGANWNTNVSNRPTELTDGRIANALNSNGDLHSRVLPGENIGTPDEAGLYLGADYMGYHDGSNWITFMDNTGQFFFAGDGSTTIAWNGTKLFGTDGGLEQWKIDSTNGRIYAGENMIEIGRDGVNVQMTGHNMNVLTPGDLIAPDSTAIEWYKNINAQDRHDYWARVKPYAEIADGASGVTSTHIHLEAISGYKSKETIEAVAGVTALNMDQESGGSIVARRAHVDVIADKDTARVEIVAQTNWTNFDPFTFGNILLYGVTRSMAAHHFYNGIILRGLNNTNNIATMWYDDANGILQVDIGGVVKTIQTA